MLGALNGYVLTKWRFRGDEIVFGLMLLACFIPFQIVLIPSARILGLLGLAGTVSGLVMIHIVYGLGFTTLFFRNYYEAFPTELATPDDVMQFVRSHADAIGFLPQADVDGSVKVLTIEGRRPGDAGYVIR